MIQRTLLRAARQAHPQTSSASAALRQTRTFSAANLLTSLPRKNLAFRAQQQRWYSDAEATKKEDSAAAAETPKAGADEAKAEDPVQKELEAKKKEVIDLTDRIKRSVADYRNLQEQTKREITAAKDFALQRFAKDLLDTVDNLDRALTTVPKEKLDLEKNPDLVALHQGLSMTEDIFLATLKRHGLERFDPAAEPGTRFDPNTMEATFQAPQPGKEDGTVFFSQSKGFTLKNRVLRAAKVGVVKNS